MRAFLPILVACGNSPPSSAPASTPAESSPEPSRDDYALVVQPSGYAVHGVDLYPPLMRRVVAVPCPESTTGDCMADEDCGPAAACLCGNSPLHSGPNVCIAAECATDDDCEHGLCFLCVAGSETCPTGLFCAREGSICEDGGDCPGNGTRCTYVAPNDRFECSHGVCP